MAGEVTRVMIFPRYSSLVGATSFTTAPLSTRAFYQTTLRMWRGGGVGVSSLSVTAELSEDMRYWRAASSGSPWTIGANTETQGVFTLDAEWMRLIVTLGGTNPAAPLWVLGEFLRREM